MESKSKILAVVVVVIVVVAAVSAYVVYSGDDDDYISTNTDGRLTILGNADENDYLNEDDIDAIQDIIDSGGYSLLADANNDGVVDEEDITKVREILDAKEYNKDKSDADKISTSVYYISVDGDVMSAQYPVKKFIIVNTQRALELSIALNIGDRVAGLTDYVFSYWDDNLYRNYTDVQEVGDRREPELETIAQIDADTIYAGGAGSYLTNVDGTTVGDKQVIRLATWENGGLENGALMLGFFTDADERAEQFVRWMDELNADIQATLETVDDPSATSFIVMSSATWICAQKDGVSTAITNTGAENVANNFITTETSSGGSMSNYREYVLDENPDYIFLGVYLYTHQTSEEITEKYEGYDFSALASTTAYQEGNIYMFNYGMPFGLSTLMACCVMFPDEFASYDLGEIIWDYLTTFTEIQDDYVFNLDDFLYHP